MGFQIKNHAFEANKPEPGLYIASTPIGNLGDITLRVLETLAGCDLIACEDTRVTAKLLNHYGINKKTVSYNEHNAEKAGPKLLADLVDGKSVTLVSDAGTPLISDPGFRLVSRVREAGIPVWPLPGATAPVSALVASGLDSDSFTFAGFLPTKQGARKSRLGEYANTATTLVFFESPNRLGKSLADMANVFGSQTPAAVARELTKLHEEIVRGTLGELSAKYNSQPVKGEIVILVENRVEQMVENVDSLLLDLLKTMSVSQAASEAVSLTGLSKRDLYQRALALKT